MFTCLRQISRDDSHAADCVGGSKIAMMKQKQLMVGAFPPPMHGIAAVLFQLKSVELECQIGVK